MKTGVLSECPIVAVTAYDSAQSEQECLQAGIDKISISFFVLKSICN